MTLLSSGGWNPNSKSVSFTCLEISALFGVGTCWHHQQQQEQASRCWIPWVGSRFIWSLLPGKRSESGALTRGQKFGCKESIQVEQSDREFGYLRALDWNAGWNYTCTVSSDIKGQPWDSSSDIHTYLDCSFKLTFPGLFWLCRMYGVLALAKWLPSWIFGQIKHVFQHRQGFPAPLCPLMLTRTKMMTKKFSWGVARLRDE